jgi:hypothetical protein
MFILIRLNQHVSGIIMPIVRRTDYVKKTACGLGLFCVGCSRAHLGHELCALCERRTPTFTQCTQLVSQLCTTAANTTIHTPHAVFYIVCSPDDGHNDARNMLS